jgi:hypothetical protein
MPKSRGRKETKRKGPTRPRKRDLITRLAFHAISDTGDTEHIEHALDHMKEVFIEHLGDKLEGELRTRIVLAAEAMLNLDQIGGWDDPIQKERIRFFLETHPSGALLIVFGDCAP